jgi:hypothetical protein
MRSGEGATLRFKGGSASADRIQKVADEAVAELRHQHSEASKRARAAGLDASELDGAEVSVCEEEQDVDPGTTILITIAINAGSNVAIKLWNDVIWPRVQKRIGDDALGDEEIGDGEE